jgi:hypothetical protein
VIRSMTSMVPEQAGQHSWFVVLGGIWARNSAEQRAAACEGGLPSSVGEEAEVADADQSFGQNVKEKSAQKLIC